jgi:hypothetical protein
MINGKRPHSDARGLRGERCPADAIGTAVMVMKISTGEIGEKLEEAPARSSAAQFGTLGGAARAKAYAG